MAVKKPKPPARKPKAVFEQDMYPWNGVTMEMYIDRGTFNKAVCFHRKVPLEDVATNALGMTSRYNTKEGTVYVIGVFDGRRSTLVHELCHLLIMIFSHYEIGISDSYGEAFAYHMDKVFLNTVAFFKKD